MSVMGDAEMCSKQPTPSVSLLPGRKSRPLQVLLAQNSRAGSGGGSGLADAV